MYTCAGMCVLVASTFVVQIELLRAHLANVTGQTGSKGGPKRYSSLNLSRNEFLTPYAPTFGAQIEGLKVHRPHLTCKTGSKRGPRAFPNFNPRRNHIPGPTAQHPIQYPFESFVLLQSFTKSP